MNRRSLRIAAVAFALVALAGCAAAPPPSPSPSASPTPDPVATTEAAYRTAACAAWASLFRAVGNPDTGSGSDLSRALDEAVQDRDRESADRLAAEITAELRVGRGHLATAAGWQPRAVVMREANRVFAAFEAMVAAKREVARETPGAMEPQAAFENAGGVEAWYAMIEAMPPAAATAEPCPGLPVTP